MSDPVLVARDGAIATVTRLATSAHSASTASAASLPVALIVMVMPGLAASIIKPMIEVPPTLS